MIKTDRELYHTALGALYYAIKRVRGEEEIHNFVETEQVFQEFLIELENRGLEIVRKS